ncbi:MAG TPA: hypothetical protein VFD70_12940 [Anaerolineae bacterium]|nr:hypothetical protein [Anaerolineae bacterium]
MTNDSEYVVRFNEQEFTIRITQAKEKQQYRAYLFDAVNNELGSGRWNTSEEADLALKEIAQRVAAVQSKVPR